MSGSADSKLRRVSILMITYNQAKFLKEAVRSVLAQQTAFAFELVIGEDCSTDGSRGLIKNLQRLNSDRIRVLPRPRKLGAVRNFWMTLEECNTEYVAFLEGDDFWTHPQKLQRQVDFLDLHAGSSLCCHPVRYVDAGGARAEGHFPRTVKPITTLEDLLRANYIPTCSLMVRRSAIPVPPGWVFTLSIADWPLCIFAAQAGTIGWLPNEMAAYRIHADGIWTATPELERHLAIVRMYENLLSHLGPGYRAVLLALLARLELKASREYETRGDRGAAIEHLARSFQYRLGHYTGLLDLERTAQIAAETLLADMSAEYTSEPAGSVLQRVQDWLRRGSQHRSRILAQALNSIVRADRRRGSLDSD